MADPYETVIGLEIHVQLGTRTKLFCGCPNTFGAPPNTNVCPVCYALPGALPVPNQRALRLAVRAGLALDCTVPPESVFERKNYFYPDLPKGYQITQFEHPVARRGGLTIPAAGGGERRVRIHRIQLEEDAGKLVHEGFPGADRHSGVDFNRAGVPLIEIVSEPDMRSPEEASAYARTLRERVVACGISDADMEKGNLRMDGNISVRRRGEEGLGVKVELKNLNSFRFLRRALAFEAGRQREALSEGRRVMQETRLFDEANGETRAMRSKEEAADYRYFPDPDIPPIRVPGGLVAEERAALPEFPDQRAARFRESDGLRPDLARTIAARDHLAAYYETVVAAAQAAGSPRKQAAAAAAAWITTEVLAFEKEEGRLAAPAEHLGGLIHLLAAGKLPRNAVREVFLAMCRTGRDAPTLVAELGLSDLAGGDRLREAAEAIVARHPAERDAWRAGRRQVVGFFMGRLMRELRGKADPREARRALEQALDDAPSA